MKREWGVDPGLSDDQGYVSRNLYHFVGYGGKSDERQFDILKLILGGGQLIHPPTQNLIQATKGGGEILLPPATQPGSRSIRIKTLSAGFDESGAFQCNLGSVQEIKWEAKFSKNEMFNSTMICFCDIPYDKLQLHMKKYRLFGLAFSKSFLIRQGVSPVFYVEKHSIRPDDSIHEEDRLREEEDFENMRRLMDEERSRMPQYPTTEAVSEVRRKLSQIALEYSLCFIA